MSEDSQQEVIGDDAVVSKVIVPMQKKIVVKTHGFADETAEQTRKVISITGLPQPPKLKPIPTASATSISVSRAPELMASKTYAAARAKLVPETKLKVINRSSLPALTPQPQLKVQEAASKPVVLPATTTITIKTTRSDSLPVVNTNSAISSAVRSVKILPAIATTLTVAKPNNLQPAVKVSSVKTATSQAASKTAPAAPVASGKEGKAKANDLTEHWKFQLKQQSKLIQAKKGNELVSREVADALSEFKRWQKENDPNGSLTIVQLNKKFNEFIQLHKPAKSVLKRPPQMQVPPVVPAQQQPPQQKRKSSEEESAQLKRIKMPSSRSSSCDSSASAKTLPETVVIKTEEVPSCKRSEHDSLYHLLRSDATNILKRKAEQTVPANGKSEKIQISNGKLSDPKGPIRVLEKLPPQMTTLAHVIPKETPNALKTKEAPSPNTTFLFSGLTARTKARRKKDLNEFQDKINKVFCTKSVTNQAIERLKSSPRRTATGRSRSLGSSGAFPVSKPKFKLSNTSKPKRIRLAQSASFDENVPDLCKVEPEVAKDDENISKNGDDFVTNLASSIAWNEQTGNGKIEGMSIRFRRNEFGLIEAIEGPSAEPKSYFNRNKLKSSTDNICGQKFDSLIRRIENAESSTINNCKPHEYYSTEFQSLMLSVVQKGDHHGKLIKAKEIVSALASASRASLEEKPKVEPSFDWEDFIEQQNAGEPNKKLKLADTELFSSPFPAETNNFAIGQKLEAIDPKNCSLFCVCTVVGIRGHRIKLHFDGYHSSYDFWTNADSKSIFPVGWCNKTGRELQPPHRRLNDRESVFDWDKYLVASNSCAAPKQCFSHLSTSITNKNPFKIGKKLEADDIKFTRKICVATIGDVIDSRILITFDGFEETSNYWTDITSPYIHPINWHHENGFSITVPRGWFGDFEWDDYLRTNRAEGVPEHAFCTRNPIDFSAGMLIEIVDKKNPFLIRPAKILMTYEYEIKVLFIGWPDEYAYWVDDDSPDIHPPGWCERTNHPLELPPSKNSRRSGCDVFGCRGIGNARKPEAPTHWSRVACPYDLKNWQSDEQQQNRIDRMIRTNNAFNFGASACRTRTPAAAVADQHTHLSLQPLLNPTELANMLPKDVEMFRRLQVSTKFLLENSETLSQQHNKWLDKIQPLSSVKVDASMKNPLNWSMERVASFVSSLPNCSMLGPIFVEHEIDGLAFLSLRQADLTDIMGLSLGSAIKVFNRIMFLREECNTHYIHYD